MLVVPRRPRSAAFSTPAPFAISLFLPEQLCLCTRPPCLFTVSKCRIDINSNNTVDEETSNSQPTTTVTDSDDSTSPLLYSDGAYTTGTELLKQDLDRLKDFFSLLVINSKSSLGDSSNDVAPSTEKPTIPTVLSRDSCTSSYEPRSATGQSVARQFSQMRGALDRAINSVHVRAVDTLRVVVLAAVTFTNSVQNATSRILEGSNVYEKGDWTLLSSFQWQNTEQLTASQPTNAEHQPTNIISRRTQQSRASDVRRSLALRKLSRRTVFAATGMYRLADAAVTKLWPGAIAALPKGRKGGAVIAIGLGTALVTIFGTPISTVVTGTTIAFTSIAVLGARAGLTGQLKIAPNQRQLPSPQKRWKPAPIPRWKPTSIPQIKQNMSTLKSRNKTETIETAAYVVSRTKPSVLSIPVLGLLLGLLDIFAYTIEKVTTILFERFAPKATKQKSMTNDGWELLQSFTEKN